MYRTTTITLGGITYTTKPDLDSQYIHESLIRRHLFPAVREDKDEIPPVFSSDSLSLPLSQDVYGLRSSTKSDSFSPMNFTFLKFNGNVRTMQIPHPFPYMRFANEVSQNWDSLYPLVQSESSRIRPKVHLDGRVVTMEYGDRVKQAIEESSRMIGKRYVVHTDITSCFPSLYTHAIDWALRGRTEAKKDRTNRTWQARIDMRIRDLQDGETIGVGIGPASSNLAAEIVLQAIDRKLLSEGFEFTRYIDDYQCFADSRECAEAFLNTLNESLHDYRLSLNHRKTQIIDVERSELDSWLHEVVELTLHESDSDLQMIRKLKSLQELARRYPDKSIMKYGFRSLEGVASKVDSQVLDKILPEVARMLWISPFLTAKTVKNVLPFVAEESEGKAILAKALEEVLKIAARRRQADVVMWSLYGLSEMNHEIQAEDVTRAIDWNPVCAALALRLFSDKATDTVLRNTRDVGSESRQLVEEQWLLRYQLWLCGGLTDVELEKSSEKEVFNLLKKHSVDFYQMPQTHQESDL